MFCSLCKKYPKVADRTGSFFLGTQSFRLQSIQVHSKSQGHWKCLEADKAAKNAQTGILQNIPNLNEQLQEKILKLFNTAYYLAINKLPMNDFGSLCMLQIKNSVDLRDFYLNDKRCKDFLESNSAVQHSAVRETLNSKRLRFLSLIADGATDVSTKAMELIYVRYLHQGRRNSMVAKVTQEIP